MLGDVAPLKEMVAVAKKHGAMVLSDEAHSMGFFGPSTVAVCTKRKGLGEGNVDFIVGTFSKSVGTVGGFCVSNHPKFEAIRLACRAYIFTASLPPSRWSRPPPRRSESCNDRDITSAQRSLGKRADAAWRPEEKWVFRLGTENPDSAIIAVILEDQEQAVTMWQALLDGGLYVNMARPPATPAGTFLLRCSLCAEHTAGSGRER